MNTATCPPEGIRVLDLTGAIADRYASLLLGGPGAEILVSTEGGRN